MHRSSAQKSTAQIVAIATTTIIVLTAEMFAWRNLSDSVARTADVARKTVGQWLSGAVDQATIGQAITIVETAATVWIACVLSAAITTTLVVACSAGYNIARDRPRRR